MACHHPEPRGPYGLGLRVPGGGFMTAIGQPMHACRGQEVECFLGRRWPACVGVNGGDDPLLARGEGVQYGCGDGRITLIGAMEMLS